MGAYSPVADLPDDEVAALLATIHRPILAELARRGTPFRGALYAGLILTADGPVLLECNARFGDPETQAILPRLAVTLGPLLLAAANGCAPDRSATAPDTPGRDGRHRARGGRLPGRTRARPIIEGLDAVRDRDTTIFHAGTARDDDGTWRTAGGRILAVVGAGSDLETARMAAEAGADRIAFRGSSVDMTSGSMRRPPSSSPWEPRP